MTAFVLAHAPTFPAEVEIHPAGVGAAVKLAVVFRHKRKSDLGKWIESLKDRPAADALDEVIESWDADKPYSKEALVDLIEDWPNPADALIHGYLQALTGARLKN